MQQLQVDHWIRSRGPNIELSSGTSEINKADETENGTCRTNNKTKLYMAEQNIFKTETVFHNSEVLKLLPTHSRLGSAQ